MKRFATILFALIMTMTISATPIDFSVEGVDPTTTGNPLPRTPILIPQQPSFESQE